MKPTYTISRFGRLACTLSLLAAPLILFAQDTGSPGKAVGERLAPPSEPVPPGEEEKFLAGPETTAGEPIDEADVPESPKPKQVPARTTVEISPTTATEAATSAAKALATTAEKFPATPAEVPAPVPPTDQNLTTRRSSIDNDSDSLPRRSRFMKATPVRQKVRDPRRLGFLMMPIRKPKAVVPKRRKVIDPKEVQEKTREALSKISPILRGRAPRTQKDLASSSIVLEELREIYRRNGLDMPVMTLKELDALSETFAADSPETGLTGFPAAPAVSDLTSDSVAEQNAPAEPGVVRISDSQVTHATTVEDFMDKLVGAPTEASLDATPAVDEVVRVDGRIQDGSGDDVIDKNAGRVTLSDLWTEHSLHFLERNQEQSEAISTWMYDELGLYTPANTGSAAPFGTYQMVYPVNPSYFDPRDTRLYGAQGAGVPIAVPLAPNVGSVFNYGTGLPASRLTPISIPR